MNCISLGGILLASAWLTTPALALAGPAAPTQEDPFAVVSAMTGDDLKTVRAGEDTVASVNAAVSDQVLSSQNFGNRVDANEVNNGAVTMDPGALQGFSGIGNFVINTGNNNNLQGSLSVTVFMAPGAR